MDEGRKSDAVWTRRKFLRAAAVATSALGTRPGFGAPVPAIFVSPGGYDANAGTVRAPVRTLERARALRRKIAAGRPAEILLRAGVYELNAPLLLKAEDSHLRIAAHAGESVTLSGGTRLSLEWRPFRNGILQARIPEGMAGDQLFVNGERQVLARFPNFDPQARYLNGTASAEELEERSRGWKHPETGYVHALQASLWGSLHARIRGRAEDGGLLLEGVWQVDRDQPMHKQYRFVEGIFEELDAPGEWFLDHVTSTLYFYPRDGMRMDTAMVELVRLESLIELRGESAAPVRGVELHGLTFARTLRTFMKTREQILRSDWRIYRGGALMVEGAEEMTVRNCRFDQVGGNAVFVNGYARRVQLASCFIDRAGASGVCFAGRESAVRSGLDSYATTQALTNIDRTPGPRGEDFPQDCRVEDCLIAETGRFEKQSAGVEIDVASRVTVKDCSIYGVPRAGINIGDGCFGGHIVDGCDIFDTVLETSDHGAFNAWGRDRWWHLRGADEDTLMEGALRILPTLDAVETTQLLRSRWACEHGWDIDLDDGSSNYRIEGNLCLSGGIKLREGFLRTVRSNITVNNTLHPHVWPKMSEDVVESNIFFVPYKPVRPHAWGKTIDRNLLHREGEAVRPATELQALSGKDEHSLTGDAKFVEAGAGDFALRKDSPVFALGFVQGPMRYGVRSADLRRIARTPDIQRWLKVQPATLRSRRRPEEMIWNGATLHNVTGLAEVSALGAPGETGVVITVVSEGSPADRAGLRVQDLLLTIDGKAVTDVAALRAASHGALRLGILRQQRPMELTLEAR